MCTHGRHATDATRPTDHVLCQDVCAQPNAVNVLRERHDDLLDALLWTGSLQWWRCLVRASGAIHRGGIHAVRRRLL